MSGSKTVRMTSEELREMVERGETRSRPLPEGQEPDLSDPDNPDCTEAIHGITRRVGRPSSGAAKVFTGLRLDADIVAAFRARGKGWQTRINDALREWLNSHPV